MADSFTNQNTDTGRDEDGSPIEGAYPDVDDSRIRLNTLDKRYAQWFIIIKLTDVDNAKDYRWVIGHNNNVQYSDYDDASETLRTYESENNCEGVNTPSLTTVVNRSEMVLKIYNTGEDYKQNPSDDYLEQIHDIREHILGQLELPVYTAGIDLILISADGMSQRVALNRGELINFVMDKDNFMSLVFETFSDLNKSTPVLLTKSSIQSRVGRYGINDTIFDLTQIPDYLSRVINWGKIG